MEKGYKTCPDCNGSCKGPKPSEAELAGQRGTKSGNAGFAAFALSCKRCNGWGRVPA